MGSDKKMYIRDGDKKMFLRMEAPGGVRIKEVPGALAHDVKQILTATWAYPAWRTFVAAWAVGFVLVTASMLLPHGPVFEPGHPRGTVTIGDLTHVRVIWAAVTVIGLIGWLVVGRAVVHLIRAGVADAARREERRTDDRTAVLQGE